MRLDTRTLSHVGAITTVTSLWLVSPVPWVRHLLAATWSDCQTYFRFAKDARTKNFQETLENDWKLFGGKFTCKLLKKAPHPPINQLMDVVQVSASRLRANGKDKPRLLLDHPICVSPSDFVSIEGCPTLVLKQDGLTLTVRGLPDHCPARCRIELELWVTAPPDVARLIECEWQPLWNRDTVEETQDLATWEHAINTIDRFGWHADAINTSTRSVEPWKAALVRMQPKVCVDSLSQRCSPSPTMQLTTSRGFSNSSRMNSCGLRSLLPLALFSSIKKPRTFDRGILAP